MVESDVARLAAQLHADSVREREEAIEALTALAQAPNAPFDLILERLHARYDWGTDRERDPAVVDALYTAVRRVAIARGRQRGLRLPQPEGIDDAPDDRLVWVSIALVWDAVSIYDGPEVLDASLAFATPEQRGLYAIWWTNSEVCNGGFDQYFLNATGIVWPYAVEGLRQIGAHEVEAIVRRAGTLFPTGSPPADRGKRQRALDQIDQAALSALDDAYYAAYPTELFSRAAAFVRTNLAAFFE
jgi:hypothetical protein